MRIAIVNRTNLKNYGSLLQSFALCEAVRQLGYEAEIIWEDGSIYKNYDLRLQKIVSILFKLFFHPKLMKSTLNDVKTVQRSTISEKTVKCFDEFINKNITRKYYKPSQMTKRNVGSRYDKFICGSDQVWCSTTLYVDPLMYLRFAPKNKRIAYAPSLGRNYIPNYNRRKMRRYINDIPFVSVRESTGERLIKELTGRDVPVTVDPTLLIPIEHWDTLKTPQNLKERYVLCYFLSTPTQETQKKLYSFIADKGDVVIALNSRLEYLENKMKVLYPDCGPSEFIGFVSDARYVFTDSYHGMLFSIMYQKEFWSVEREYGEFDQSSRQRSLLETIGLTNRYIDKNRDFSLDVIDYGSVETCLNKEILKSQKYLKEALDE